MKSNYPENPVDQIGGSPKEISPKNTNYQKLGKHEENSSLTR